jgi:hypothetical protein
VLTEEIKPDTMKLVSVSPFRAVVKVEDDEESVEEDFQREVLEEQAQIMEQQ